MGLFTSAKGSPKTDGKPWHGENRLNYLLHNRLSHSSKCENIENPAVQGFRRFPVLIIALLCALCELERSKRAGENSQPN